MNGHCIVAMVEQTYCQVASMLRPPDSSGAEDTDPMSSANAEGSHAMLVPATISLV